MQRYNQEWNDRQDPGRITRRQQRAKRRADRDLWTNEQDAFLGTDTDAKVGELLGKTQKSVYARRERLGIPRFRKPMLSKKGGYVLVPIESSDPMWQMARDGRYVLEHRLVMARELGRPLTADEFVHHKNGIKTDNNIANLELWTRSHPDGQRVTDILAWAMAFVARYEPLQMSFFGMENGQ